MKSGLAWGSFWYITCLCKANGLHRSENMSHTSILGLSFGRQKERRARQTKVMGILKPVCSEFRKKNN